ncbi:MAG: hypothetical protein KDJ16_15835 [Hyphomicrobiales bacterium]|nr:hypothetical protein [Hyphomicrobiales bacterium]
MASNDIERVLKAERDGDVLVRDAHAEAEVRREAARAAIRRITGRTDVRISALHGRFEATLAARLADLRAAAAEESRKPAESAWSATEIERAAKSIAAVLTGGRDVGNSG